MLRTAASTIARRTGVVARRGIPAGGVFPQRMAFHASLRRDEEAKAPAAKEEDTSSGWDPIYAVPLGIAFAVPAINYEWYLVNEETQLAACFIAFCAVVYKQFGGVIQEALEEDGKRVLAEHNAAEDQIISYLEESIDNMKAQSTIVQDVEDIKALKAQTYAKLNEAGKIKPLYDFKSQVEKLLAMIATEEASMQEKAKIEMMADATAAVGKQFASNKDLRKAALTNAVATLKGKGGARDDPVKKVYLQYFAAKKAQAAKIDAAAEAKASREAILLKLNAVAKNEGFFFQFDESGKPKMVV